MECKLGRLRQGRSGKDKRRRKEKDGRFYLGVHDPVMTASLCHSSPDLSNLLLF